MPTSTFRLSIDLRREARFRSRGVPVVELWASGPQFTFLRVAGIWDSGASRTLLAEPTAQRLGFKMPRSKMPIMSSVVGFIRYVPRIVYFRIPVPGRPAVHFPIEAGISPDITENLFGVDMNEYFSSLLREDRVTLLGDERHPPHEGIGPDRRT